MRTRAAVVVPLALAALIGATPPALVAQGAVITNGVVQLGINEHGDLNFGGVGLKDVASGFESTFGGCPCEGWGVGVAGGTFDGVWGGANRAVGAATNLHDVNFTFTASTATSTVTIRSGTTDVLRVTHEYVPHVATGMYEVRVTITNLTGGVLGDGAQGLRYRRLMDWDIPFPGPEVVTLRGNGATNLIGTSDDGFQSPNPFSSRGGLIEPNNTDFVDSGPSDHGALFDFAFGALDAGSSRTFLTYYGSAANVTAMRAKLGVVGAEVYSYAFCAEGRAAGCLANGAPATFAFAFEGVGGTPIEPPPGEPPVSVIPEPGTVLLVGTGLAGILFARRRRRI